MSDQSPIKQTRAERALNRILDWIQKGQCELFSDVVRVSYLRISKLSHLGAVRLDSRDARGVIAHLVHQDIDEILNPAEIELLMPVLRGHALANRKVDIDDADILTALERNEFVQVVLRFMLRSDAGVFVGTCTELGGLIKQYINQTEPHARVPPWFTNPTLLSKQLRRQATIDLLHECGVEVSFPPRAANARTVRLERTSCDADGPDPDGHCPHSALWNDADTVTASNAASLRKLAHNRDIENSDADPLAVERLRLVAKLDARKEKLDARIRCTD